MNPADILEHLGAKRCAFCKQFTDRLGWIHEAGIRAIFEDTPLVCYECALNHVNEDEPIMTRWWPTGD